MAPDTMPPPYEPPLADSAPQALVSFVYLLLRDGLPAGDVERMMMQSAQHGVGPVRYTNPELAAYAERVAKTLVYEATAVAP